MSDASTLQLVVPGLEPDDPRPDATPAPAIPMVVVELLLRARQQVSLPRYSGATIRGSIGSSLRDLACRTGRTSCEGCPESTRCSYGVVWEAAAAAPTPKRFGEPPRPYGVDPVAYGARRTFDKGDPLRLRVKLFGDARDHVPYVVLATRMAARRGIGRGRSTLELVSADCLSPTLEPTPVYGGGELLPTTALPTWHLTPPPPDQVTGGRLRLRLETLLQLTHKGRAASSVHPELLTAPLADRFDLMARAHSGADQGLDFRALREASSKVRLVHADLVPERFERFAQRKGKRVPMQGLLGEVVFDEVPPEVHALWSLARHLHVGKQATFGFGRVAVEAITP